MDIQFTDRQLDLMNVLWERGSATVREAREELDEDLAHTSVLTVFQTLEKDGHVEHEREGKAYRFYPTVTREESGRDAVEYLLRRVFRSSPEAMMETLLERADSEDGDGPDGGTLPGREVA